MAEGPDEEQREDDDGRVAGLGREINDPLTQTDTEAPRKDFGSKALSSE